MHDLPKKRSEEKETSGDTSVFLGRWERPGGERRKKTKVRGLRGAENVARRLDVETGWSQLDYAIAIKFSFQEDEDEPIENRSGRIGYAIGDPY